MTQSYLIRIDPFDHGTDKTPPTDYDTMVLERDTSLALNHTVTQLSLEIADDILPCVSPVVFEILTNFPTLLILLIPYLMFHLLSLQTVCQGLCNIESMLIGYLKILVQMNQIVKIK